jgi:tetratricopeptide (TPR) repeat protein
MKNRLFLSLFVAQSFFSHAQQTNVIGATAQRFPEAEMDEQSRYIDANQKYLLGDYDKAKAIVTKFIYDHPENDGAYFLLARIALKQKEYPEALEASKKAIKADPSNVWYYHLQGDIYEATGRTDDAITTYENLSKQRPNSPDYFDKLSYLYALAGKGEQAITTLDRWEKMIGITEELADKRHLVCIGMKNDKGAIDAYRNLIKLYPKNPAYQHKLARYFKETNRPDKAAELYQSILAISPNDPDARLGAIKTQDKAKSDDLLAELRPLLADRTIKIDGKITALMPFLKGIEQEQDSSKRAMLQSAATDLTLTHPYEAKAWSFAGDAHYLMNENEQALKLYQKCIALQPEVFSVWQNTFEILRLKADYNMLATEAEKGMDAFPNQAASYYYFGLASNQLNKPNDALTALQQAMVMSGNQIGLKLDISTQLAQALILQGKSDKAIEQLIPTLPKGGQKHPELLETLGDAYQAQGDKSKALEYWKSAQKIRQSPSLLKKIG